MSDQSSVSSPTSATTNRTRARSLEAAGLARFTDETGKSRRLTVGARAAYSALLKRAGRRTRIAIAVSELARLAGVSEDTVERAIPQWEAAGVVRRTFKPGHAARFTRQCSQFYIPRQIVVRTAPPRPVYAPAAPAARATVPTSTNESPAAERPVLEHEEWSADAPALEWGPDLGAHIATLLGVPAEILTSTEEAAPAARTWSDVVAAATIDRDARVKQIETLLARDGMPLERAREISERFYQPSVRVQPAGCGPSPSLILREGVALAPSRSGDSAGPPRSPPDPGRDPGGGTGTSPVQSVPPEPEAESEEARGGPRAIIPPTHSTRSHRDPVSLSSCVSAFVFTTAAHRPSDARRVDTPNDRRRRR